MYLYFIHRYNYENMGVFQRYSVITPGVVVKGRYVHTHGITKITSNEKMALQMSQVCS